jgi:hypothetical protein
VRVFLCMNHRGNIAIYIYIYIKKKTIPYILRNVAGVCCVVFVMKR